MRVLVQWAQRTPADWEEIDPHADPQAWTRLPKKARPSGVQNLNNQRGWVNAVNVGNVIWEHDVYAVEAITVDGEPAIRAYGWNDQSVAPGEEIAAVWTILPLVPHPTQGFTSRMSSVHYLGTAIYDQIVNSPFGVAPNVTIRHWSEFVPPPEPLRRYGVQLTNADFQAHRTRRRMPAWTDW